MTLPRLAAIMDYWGEWPPVHISAAAFMGVKPQPKASSNASQPLPDNFEDEFLALTPER